MDPNTFPTKGNLILAKNSLKLSRQGYELMDKKRNILIREMMELIDQAKDIQTQIDVTFRTAYTALQKANMEIGIAFVQQIACTVPVENSIRIKTRSVMGTEIPLVEYDNTTNTPTYAEAFKTGLKALSRIATVHLGTGAKQTAQALTNVEDVDLNVFDGPCPAGNVDVQINHVAPMSKNKTVWTVDPTAVIFIGRLFLTGKVDLTRTIAVAGSRVLSIVSRSSAVTSFKSLGM